MSGECNDCGNAVCVCREVEKQPDISNCILVDKDLFREIVERENKYKELLAPYADADHEFHVRNTVIVSGQKVYNMKGLEEKAVYIRKALKEISR